MGGILDFFANFIRHALGQRLGDIFAAYSYFLDGDNQLTGSAVLSQVAGCAQTQGALGILLFGVHTEQQHARLWADGVDLAQQVQPAAIREGNVEQDNIVNIVPDGFQCLVGGTGFIHNQTE